MMDATSRGNAAIAAGIARDSVPKAVCKKCGTDMVAWVQSKKTQKWYLADAIYGTPPGFRLPAKHLPHFKSCTGKA